MSMSERIAGIPGRIKGKLAAGVQAAIGPMDAEVKKVLGVQGDRFHRSKPGQSPRRQVGTLQAGSGVRWTASPLIRIVIYTTQIGKWLDAGTPRILPRPIEKHIRPKFNEFMLRIVKKGLE